MKKLSLDDLYYMTASIFSEQNANRSIFSTFAHFVEVCGMLCIQRHSERPDLSVFESALCRALGWFFPLAAKCHIRSLEEVIWMKYPNVCPYCRLTSHRDDDCNDVRGVDFKVDHKQLKQLQNANITFRPSTLNEWQSMFQRIYTRTSSGDRTRSIIGLTEEIGEMAESLRVFDRHPRYLVGEIADVFSWLVGFANEYNYLYRADLSNRGQDVKDFDFESAYLARYPGICIICGKTICSCNSIPKITLKRMSKELDITDKPHLFLHDGEDLLTKGSGISSEVMESLGGFLSICGLEKTDCILNSGENVITACIGIADILEPSHKIEANDLRSIAFRIRNSKKEYDLKRYQDFITSIEKNKEPSTEDMSYNILHFMSTPIDFDPIQCQKEFSVIEEAIKSSKHRDKFQLKTKFTTSVAQILQEIKEGEYNILHFSGHGDPNIIYFRDEEGKPLPVKIEELKALLSQCTLECVIFNCCSSLSSGSQGIGKYTIGLIHEYTDEYAIAFSKFFYGTLGAGYNIEGAFDAAKACLKVIGMDETMIVLVK